MDPLWEVPSFAFRNLTTQGVRSFLTLTGVIIGIAAIVTLFTLSAGLTRALSDQFEMLGSNTLYVLPGNLLTSSGSSSNLKTFSPAFISRLESLPRVEIVLATVYSMAQVRAGRESRQLAVIGASAREASYYESSGYISLSSGRTFDSRDQFVVVVGHDLAASYFSSPLRLNSRILIEGKSFRVIGITKQSATTPGDAVNSNNALFIPKRGFAQIFPETDPIYLMIKTLKVEDVDLVKNQISRLLEKEFGRDQKVFTVESSDQLLDQVYQLFSVVQLVIVGIASVSLLVGGVGIANTTVMSVMERTPEIGLMKAVGATNTLVLSVFLAEAAFIGLAGGVLGILVGYALAFLVEFISTAMGLAINVEWDVSVILFTLAFSLVVGMVSGFVPARQAARMDPVVALRSAG